MRKQYNFQVLPPNTNRTEELRTIFRERMSKLYTGWCDDFDRQFDDHSFLFLLKDTSTHQILATCRLVFVQYNTQQYTSPIGLGDTMRYDIPSTSNEIICEGGMVSFLTRDSIIKLMYGTLSWVIENKVDHIYTSYDINNALIKRLYTRTLSFPTIKGASTTFSNFKSKRSGQPVTWQVVGGSLNDKAPAVLERLKAMGADLPYEQGQHVRAVDWLY